MISRAQTGNSLSLADMGHMADAALPRFQLDYQSFRDLHKILCLKPQARGAKSRFACYLALYFPEVADLIDESDFSILHLEVGVLKLASRDAIAKGDWDALSRHFAFVMALLNNGGGELRDALSVSYLGELFYGESTGNFAVARCLLPQPLDSALEGLERHYGDRVL
ncbi:MAG TPA: hypothetical protein VIU46_03070 [Gallionellaceae bacterium]